jgi:hypothetical protein
MEKLFAEFQATEKNEWLGLIHKELKGESPDLLQKFNPIEEIVLPSYFHKSDLNTSFSDPGLEQLFQFLLKKKQTNMDWMH